MSIFVKFGVYTSQITEVTPSLPVWDGTTHNTYILTTLHLRTNDINAKSIYIDLTNLELGDIIHITRGVSGNKDEWGFSADLVADLPEFGETVSDLTENDFQAGDDVYIEHTDLANKSLIFYYDYSGSGTIASVVVE
jgi:hypothetical protein